MTIKSAVFWVLGAAIAVALSASHVAATTAPLPPDSVDARQMYGDRVEFDVFRNGKKVGRHVTTFTPKGDELVVDTTFELEIKLLLITAYRYKYTSVGVWQGDTLKRLKAKTDDNGTTTTVVAAHDGGAMTITTNDAKTNGPAPLFPTNHWHPGVLNADKVLNTITGKVNNVRIEKRGLARVDTERGKVDAQHFAYTGDLLNEVWYDDAGRWVKMRFKGTDGSDIDYVCRRCQGPAAGAVPVTQ